MLFLFYIRKEINFNRKPDYYPGKKKILFATFVELLKNYQLVN